MGRNLMLALGLLVVCGAGPEKVDNPQYLAWKKFGVGSSATLESTMTVQNMNVKVTTTNTLAKITDEKVSLDVAAVVDMMGKSSTKKMKQDVTAKVNKQDLKENPDEETIEAAGKSFKCKVVESMVANPTGGSGKAKLWLNDEVPGGIVKIEATTSAGKLTTVLKSFEAK